MSSQTLTVLFADLVGSTRLYELKGDVEAHQQISDSLQCMRGLVEYHDGILLRTVGDAVLASFSKTDSALLASMAIQNAHRELNLSVRVGFHHGPVIPDAGDVYGNAVNLAARVADFAESQEICTTEAAVAQLSVLHRSRAVFLDKIDFKGITQPMPVYRILWDSDNEGTAIVGGVSNTKRYQKDQTLELLIGAKHFRVDASNPVMTFGRSFDNDVIIDVESASRNHASIELFRGRFIVKDSSTNGTYVARGGLSPEFIRRETTTLASFGAIGLGLSPESDGNHVIKFRITKSSH